MKQKQKIILLLSSFFCGIPLIFFSLRKNNQENNLQVKKKEKEEIVDNKPIINHQENQSSSFFLIIIGTIIFLIIVSIIIYKKKQKKEEKHQSDKREKFVCGLELDISNEKIKIIFCQSWDTEAFFDQLWKLDVTESELRNEHKQFYNNFLKTDIKEKIKNFFNLMMNVLKIIDFYLLKEILQNKKPLTSYSRLVTMAKKIQQKKKTLHSKAIVYGKNNYENNGNLVRAYQKNDPLSYFKIAIREMWPYYLGTNEENTPFIYFYNLFDYLCEIQQELKKFLSSKKDQKHQELLKKIQENDQKIDDDFFNVKN